MKRPKLRWMDDMNALVEWKGLNTKDVRICLQDGDRWRRIVLSTHVWVT
jgi:hypothetical protein